MTKALGQELASRNITVNCVAPGFIVSPMTDALPDAQKEALTTRILGALWDSSVFPGARAPAGKVLLRVMIGGALDPEAVALPEDELLRIARSDLRTTMGLDAAPERHWLFRHKVGISQYTVGHAARLATIAARLANLPGLYVAGQSYFGVSMNGCCEQAARFADERISALASGGLATP